MKKFSNGLLGFIILLSILTVPALVAAQTITGSGGGQITGSGGGQITGSGGGQITGSGGTTCAPNTVCNPLQFGTFCTLLKAIFNDILVLGIPIATLFIVWAGFKLVLARGNEKELTDAKRNLWYIVIGIALFLGAWTLSQIIANTLAALGGGGGLC